MADASPTLVLSIMHASVKDMIGINMRILLVAIAAMACVVGSPANAQFFLKSPNLKGQPVTGVEPDVLAQPLPGATPKEFRAAVVWNVRAALNIAALQCQFAPMLLTAQNYEDVLRDHEVELKDSYDTLSGYFDRKAKSKVAGQREFDRFATRMYSGYSTVSAQRIFCQTVASIGAEAAFTPRGDFYNLAARRIRELRSSLVPWGEQQFPGGNRLPNLSIPLAFGDDYCWRGSEWDSKRCGAPFVGRNK